MNSKITVFINKYFFEIVTVLVLLLHLMLQVFAVNYFGDKSVFLIVGINLGLLFLIIQYHILPNFFIYLLGFALLPLIYINNQFHYVFKIEIWMNITLYVFFILSVAQQISTGNIYIFRFSRFQKLILIFIILAILSSVYGLVQGYDKERIFMEFYHYFYYFFALVFFYIFTDRKQYILIFKIIAIIFILVSLGHILLFVLSSGARFVSFQSNFTPFIIGIFYGYILYDRRRKFKFLFVVSLLILLTGEILTLTRGLWVTTLIVLAAITLIYLFQKKGWKAKTFFTLIFAFSFGLLFFKSDVGDNNSSGKVQNEDIEYRSQSILNPGEDTSFLMRVEFGYYTIVEFLSSPIIGKGIGDELKYKIFSNVVNAHLPKSYPDNSYLYFLWKQGLIGFIIFIWMYLRFFRLSYNIFVNTKNQTTKIICLAIVGGMLGTFANGLLTAVLIKYKLNLLFAFMFAYVEFESRKLMSENYEK